MAVAVNNINNILLETQILTESELSLCLNDAQQNGATIINTICNLNFAEKDNLMLQLRNAFELEFGYNFVNLSDIEVDIALLSIIPYEILEYYKILPIKREGEIFTIAMVQPDNILGEREIKTRLSGFKKLILKKNVVLEDDFKDCLKKLFPDKKEDSKEEKIEQNTDEIISSMGVDLIENATDNIDMADLTDSAQEAPIIQLANSILGVAISRGISDIHIEPREKDLVVRYRQDGVLSKYKTLPKKIQNALISRYKIMSELDIAERRLPQDGRIRVKMANKFIDFRVSTLPGKFGEKIVMRILDKSNISFGLDQLITDKSTLELIREMINRPFGIIFVTGPTGSGKTTTLYSALSERNTDDVNISTIEDPIEYDLSGITQTEVNKTIGMDFSRALRAFLRQDPDIMLVGETRDRETAKIAVEAALTGHLVFTTLHTNDAPSSLMRLQEMEVEPFLISSSTIGVVAQRLLRRVCTHCKEEFVPDKSLLKFLNMDNLENPVFYRGKGCEQCNGTGYKGRIGAYEVMKINDNLRELIANGANTALIRLAAQEAGMQTLMEYSMNLAKEGYTTLDEIIRVTFTNEGSASICPHCHKPVGEEYYKCPFCQYELKKVCPKCSNPVEKDWASCSKCGFRLIDTKYDNICEFCGGEISEDSSECPWCYQKFNKL
ncbi:MAG: ATPase, T2SS/T4P/T4SS family [Candidatus Gastranaerophilales bacterium]|nr:ATPase, T2SS/T4P/T4SS family [Candidatus Gastranaerophilales bacterium]